MKECEPIYKVIFTQNAKTYELHARYISEETMVGFIEVEELIFSTEATLVDPSEEKLKAEFKNVERIYIPLHAICRIDEVIREGASRIKDHKTKGKGNVWHLPKKKSTDDDHND
jgi:hypothetical protein